MVGVGYRGLEDVDIFDLLGLNPSDFSNFKPSEFPKPSPDRVWEVERLQRAYKRLRLITHPDKAINHPDRKGDITKFQQLSQLNEFLLQFNTSCLSIWRRIAELFRRGKDGFQKPAPTYMRCSSGHSRGCKPGSSLSNPIVLDAPGICAPAVGSPKPKGKPRIKTKPRRQHSNRRSSYRPSRASGWNLAPYADQSDTDWGGIGTVMARL